MKKISFIILMLFITCSTIGQVIINPYAISNSAPAYKAEVRINLSTVSQSVATYNNITGSPHSGVVTNSNLVDIAGVSTGIGFTTISTANWNPYSGVSSNNPCCAITGASFFGSTANNAAVAGSNFFNYGTLQPARYDATKPQFRLTGLNPSSTYEIKISGLDGNLGFDCNMVFRAVGLTSPSAINVDGNVTSQSNGATFTIQPTSGGQIELWANSQASTADLAMICAIFITEQ